MGRLLIVGSGAVGFTGAVAAVEDGVVAGIAGVVDPSAEVRDEVGSRFGCPAYANSADVPPARDGDRALVAFSSRADDVSAEIVRMLSLGYHVVTTCEELAWPERHVWQALQTSAQSNRRVVIATGANPGYAMDRLPLVAADGARRLTGIEVHRRVDTRDRREQLVRKTGKGLTEDEFDRGVKEGSVGHVGLVESARLLAEGLGWRGHDVSERVEPILADGRVTGIHQHATIRVGEKRVDLDLVMDWGLPDPSDTVIVHGEPPITLVIEGGYHGDRGTTAQIVLALDHCNELEPGFYRPTDLPFRFSG